MSDPHDDLPSRVTELEDQLRRVQRELSEERGRAADQRRAERRSRGMRLALLVVVGGAYVIYLRWISQNI